MVWARGRYRVEPGTTRLEGDLDAGRIDAAGCRTLREVRGGLCCHSLDLSKTAVRTLSSDLVVELRLDLSGCVDLESLPDGLTTGTLLLDGCTALERLPARLSAAFLSVNGCTALRALPDDLRIRHGRLQARDCPRLERLPAGMGPLAQLDVSGCTSIAELPEGLVVTSWVDVAGTGIAGLPASMAGVHVHWRGVPIDERIAFRPGTISGREVLHERNAERRRVMLARVGYERFLADVDARVIDEDTDAGGPRRLLHVALEGDEDLVCVAVQCPSTGQRYLLRVPPDTTTCRKAVAWTAGFDDPDDYRPVIET